MELHLRYRRIEAEYFYGFAAPFYMKAIANDGHEYNVEAVEVKRCRCAGWSRERREYIEDGEKYWHDEWTGPGDGIAFITDEKYRIR